MRLLPPRQLLYLLDDFVNSFSAFTIDIPANDSADSATNETPNE